MKHLIQFTLLTIASASLLAGCSGSKKESVSTVPETVVDASTDINPIVLSDAKLVDGGKYMEKEDITDINLHGGHAGVNITPEKYYSLEREKSVPLNKLLFVATDEAPARCVLGKFVEFHKTKKLIVYTKSPVPTSYCVYQKAFNSDGEGFVISVKDGGMCKPGFTEVVDKNGKKFATISTIDNIISFKYCIENTMSYGATMAKGMQPQKK